MLSTRSSDLQQKTLLIKQDDKFFSRLLSRELSINSSTKNGSFRGLPSSVPFTWESQPGTPKHHFHSPGGSEVLPPLTPPPSYYYSAKRQNSFTANPIHTLFLKLNIIKQATSTSSHVAHHSSSPFISSYSTSSSISSSISTALTPSSCTRTRFGSWGGSSSSSSSKVDEDDSTGISGSPSSTLCFMIKRRSGSRRGCNLQKKKV